ncbi:MAG: transcription antitermination factor NusB [Bacteroidetes bacterium]|nr:MAG: transcription antitermination factor NusB [Bacteroidota bacterium]
MLNRRQLRIKALQSIYAHLQSGSDDLKSTEKVLLKNINELYNLYIYQLSFLSEVVRFAEESLEASKNKYIPTDDDLNPNTLFVNNAFIKALNANKDFQRKEYALKINWKDADEIVRKVVHDFRSSKEYVKYMQNETSTFKEDKDILIKLVRNHLIHNEVLRSYFEEIHSMWSEDYYMGLALVIKTLHDTKASWNEDSPLPELFKVDAMTHKNEDKKFLIDLVHTTILNKEKYDEIIIGKLHNWEFDRIAVMDLILLRMGMTEIFEMPSIPLKVTLNESIELAKHFSSPRSSVFINGLLDRTIAEGLKNKTIVKTGRGLIG